MKERTYQSSLVILFTLSRRFIMLDRNALAFLFPILMKTLAATTAIGMARGELFGTTIQTMLLKRRIVY